ncbi:sugar transferase [Anabaena sp. CCY 9910]|uniref:sugar transferase n=1 Tax=Anabaena sp. CCY 9910 TaxID=3103870 RepID=UPI0039DF6289
MSNVQLDKTYLDLREPVFIKLRKGSWWLRLVTLVIVDFSLLLLAWVLAKNYSTNYNWFDIKSFSSISIAAAIQIGALAIQGNYHSGKKWYDYLNILKTLTFAHGLILFFCLLYQPIIESKSSSLIIWSWVFSTTFVCFGRYIVYLKLNYLRRFKLLGRAKIFIICESQKYEKFVNLINKDERYVLLGQANANCLDRDYRQETLGKLNKLGVTEIFVSWDAIKNRIFVCWLFQAAGIAVHIVPMELNPIHRDIDFNRIGGMTYLTFDCPIITGRDFWIKRSFDFCFASLFLLLTFPVYLAIAIAIKLDSPGTVFYKQTRIGIRGKQFKVWKFRTMKSDAEKMQKELEALNEVKDGIIFKIKDDPRITKVGKFLRRYSLDELPQIFNVLLGEMSLVGPRPLPTRDVEKFSERHFIRQEVLPGITGLWQVSGRSNILDFEQIINLDLNYIENWSLRLDFEILLKTVRVVLKKEGAY